MRHNGRPPLLASTIRANDLEIRPGEPRSMVCPDCGRWRIIRDRMISLHFVEDGKGRCPGTGQRVRIDIALATLEARQIVGIAQTGLRRPARV